MSRACNSSWLLCALLAMGWGALPDVGIAQAASDWRTHYACVREHADLAYRLAAAAVLLPDTSGRGDAAVQTAIGCAHAALDVANEQHIKDHFDRLSSNLEALQRTAARPVPSRGATSNGAGASDPGTRPAPLRIPAVQDSARAAARGPISRAAAFGAVRVSHDYSTWLADVVEAAALRTRSEIAAVRTDLESLRRQTEQTLLYSRYNLLHADYTLIRAELDRLAALQPEPPPRRIGWGITGYEGRIVGAGVVRRTRVLRREALVSAYYLAGRDVGWNSGGELSAGVIVSGVALLPGIVLMDGSRAALSGSVVLVRAGTPMMGVSFSSVQGIGLKMIVGL
jgi:hypothetical protein